MKLRAVLLVVVAAYQLGRLHGLQAARSAFARGFLQGSTRYEYGGGRRPAVHVPDARDVWGAH